MPYLDSLRSGAFIDRASSSCPSSSTGEFEDAPHSDSSSISSGSSSSMKAVRLGNYLHPLQMLLAFKLMVEKAVRRERHKYLIIL